MSLWAILYNSELMSSRSATHSIRLCRMETVNRLPSTALKNTVRTVTVRLKVAPDKDPDKVTTISLTVAVVDRQTVLE